MDSRLCYLPVPPDVEKACSSAAVRNALSSLTAQSDFDLADPKCQEACAQVLSTASCWEPFIKGARSSLEAAPLQPLLIGRGLGICEDNMIAQCMLIALARSLFPEGLCPPYEVGNLAVTEVVAKEGSSEASHSTNDKPAPPHCAGFFEPLPPQYNFFACVHPHEAGGGATFVVDVASVLAGLSAVSTTTLLRSDLYQYRTSARLGHQQHPLTPLSFPLGIPFLRYREEYMEVPAEGRQAIQNLTKLVCESSNQIAHILQRDEVLVFFNGVPHGRRVLEQAACKAESEAPLRKLLRCRVSPKGPEWKAHFQDSCQIRTTTVEGAAELRQRWATCTIDALRAKRQLRIETIEMNRKLGETAAQAAIELETLELLLQERGLDLNVVPSKRLKTTQHGSYETYYNHRTVEPRMNILQQVSENFRQARVLDIGCNSGELSAAAGCRLNAGSMVGVDIDPDLVSSARERFGKLDACCKIDFYQGDWGNPSFSGGGLPAGNSKFDVIMCFSVTKWIHLNHGDAGVMHLFCMVHEHLVPDGIFVLEPQPLKSYQKVNCLSEEMKTNFGRMQLPPNLFAYFLTSGALRPGFKLVSEHLPDDTSQRKVFIFKKLQA